MALQNKLEKHSIGSHKDLRVFMSAEPAGIPSAHIIPQGILENSIKITNEPPTGIQANVHKALDNFNQVCTTFDYFSSNNCVERRTLSLLCASVLLKIPKCAFKDKNTQLRIVFYFHHDRLHWRCVHVRWSSKVFCSRSVTSMLWCANEESSVHKVGTECTHTTLVISRYLSTYFTTTWNPTHR